MRRDIEIVQNLLILTVKKKRAQTKMKKKYIYKMNAPTAHDIHDWLAVYQSHM